MEIEVTFDGDVEKERVLEAVKVLLPENFQGSAEEGLKEHLKFVVKDLFVKGSILLVQKAKQPELAAIADGLFVKAADKTEEVKE